jgi:glycosidase
MQKIKPDVYLVGEVWSNAKDVAPYLKGLPALFNFDMGYAITSVVQAGMDTVGLISKYKSINDFYLASTNEFIDATFLKNHDQNRILNELDNNTSKARVAAGILLTLPGTPYIYYGEEIGMKGVKPDELIREPFIWDAGTTDKMQTSWEKPTYSTDQTVVPLASQKSDPQSLYNFYKNFIHYRNSNQALTYGTIEKTNLTIRELVSFIRKKDGEERLVIHNVSDVEITLVLDSELSRFKEIDFVSIGQIKRDDKAWKIPAYASVVFK